MKNTLILMVAIALISITVDSMAAVDTTKTAKQYAVYTGTGTDSMTVINGDSIQDAKFAKGQLVKVGPYALKDSTGKVYEKGDIFSTTSKATGKKKYFYAQEGYTLTTDAATGEQTLNAKAGDTLLPSYVWAILIVSGISLLVIARIRRRNPARTT